MFLNFLEKLQSADQTVKKRWLIISSILIMSVVLFIWLKYLNALVQSPGNEPVPESMDAALSFWQTLKIGAGVIYRGLASQITNWLELLKSPKSYIIQP